MRFRCDSCNTWYRATFADPRVLGKPLVVKCKRCGADITIEPSAAADLPTELKGPSDMPGQLAVRETTHRHQESMLNVQLGVSGSGTEPANGTGELRRHWFLDLGAQPAGPYSSEEIAQRIRAGEVTLTTPIWQVGVGQWMPTSYIVDFATTFAESTPALPVSGEEVPEGRAITERVSDEAFAAIAAADAAAAEFGMPDMVVAAPAAAAAVLPGDADTNGTHQVRDTVPAPAEVVAEAMQSARAAVAPAQAHAQGRRHEKKGKNKDRNRRNEVVGPPRQDTVPVDAPPEALESAAGAEEQPGVAALGSAAEAEIAALNADAAAGADAEPIDGDTVTTSQAAPEMPSAAGSPTQEPAPEPAAAAPVATEATSDVWQGPAPAADLTPSSITAKTPSPFAAGMAPSAPAAAKAEAPATPAAVPAGAPVSMPKVFTHPRILPVPVGAKPKNAPRGRTADAAKASALAAGKPGATGGKPGNILTGLGIAAAVALAAVVTVSLTHSPDPGPLAAPPPAATTGAPPSIAPPSIAPPSIAPPAQEQAAAPAPAAPAPVAAAPVAAAPVAAPPAIEPAPAPAAAPPPVTTAAAGPAAASPPTEPATPAKEVAEGKPGKTEPASAGSKKAAAKQEVVAAGAPKGDKAEAADPKAAAGGALDPDDVEAGFSRMTASVRMCARAEERRDPEAKLGTINLSVTIGPAGDVAAVGLSNVDADSELAQCIRAAVKRVKYPAFEGKPQTVRRSFDLGK